MVDYTEPICQLIDSSLSQMLTFDTSGIELYVTENNPKTLNALIKKLKVFYKDKPDIDPYKIAYGLMPSQAASCPDAKQMYINRHFCYADKFAILTNGLGIVRHISFIDDSDFKSSHPELSVQKNRILLMKINRSVMLLLLSLSSATTSHSILIFIQILFLEILPLILLSCMESYSMTLIFPGH